MGCLPPLSNTSNTIVGRNLFQFISGLEVSHLYRKLASRVASTGCTISFDYRCDGPHVRRDMQMQLSRDAELIRYESTTVRETVREKDLPSETPGAEVFVAICSFCNDYRFPVKSKVWQQLEELLKEIDLPTEFRFTHGVCEKCYSKALEY